MRQFGHAIMWAEASGQSLGMLLHGRVISVLFDADGKHYSKGAGLQVLVDGVKAATAPTLSKLVVNLS